MEAVEAGDPRLLSTRPRGAGTGESKLRTSTIKYYAMQYKFTVQFIRYSTTIIYLSTCHLRSYKTQSYCLGGYQTPSTQLERNTKGVWFSHAHRTPPSVKYFVPTSNRDQYWTQGWESSINFPRGGYFKWHIWRKSRTVWKIKTGLKKFFVMLDDSFFQSQWVTVKTLNA